MDPNEAAKRIEQALASGAVFEAYRLMRDLVDWLQSGGFAPDWGEYPRAHGYWLRHAWKWTGRE